MRQYAKIIGGRPQLYVVPDDVVELTDEQVAWMLAHPEVATLDEILAMKKAPPPPPSLDELKAVKMRELNIWNAAAISAGYTDAEGRTWGIADSDRSVFTQFFTGLERVKQLADDAVIPPIREQDGATFHQVTLGEFRSILSGIMDCYVQIDATYATLRAAIAAAQDEAALDAIEIPGIATP